MRMVCSVLYLAKASYMSKAIAAPSAKGSAAHLFGLAVAGVEEEAATDTWGLLGCVVSVGQPSSPREPL